MTLKDQDIAAIEWAGGSRGKLRLGLLGSSAGENIARSDLNIVSYRA